MSPSKQWGAKYAQLRNMKRKYWGHYWFCNCKYQAASGPNAKKYRRHDGGLVGHKMTE